MKRLFASVAISALALSGAAFAADAPSAVQKAQAPVTSSAPAKTDDAKAKKPIVAKKTDKKASATTETPVNAKPTTH